MVVQHQEFYSSWVEIISTVNYQLYMYLFYLIYRDKNEISQKISESDYHTKIIEYSIFEKKINKKDDP